MGYQIRIFDHTADFGVEIYADSLAELITGCFQCLQEQLWELPARVMDSRVEAVDLCLEEGDTSSHLVDLLNEWLYFTQDRRILYRLEEVTASDTSWKVSLRGAPLEPSTLFQTEIKAVTYHQAECRKTDDRRWYCHWIADV